MESMRINSAIEYGFYYAPVFSYYFSTVLWHGKNHKQFNRNREVFVLHLGYTDNVFLSRLITWACFFYTCNKDYMKLMMKKER